MEESKDSRELRRLKNRPKKSIGELLYSDSHDLNMLFRFVKDHERINDNRTCRDISSVKAHKEYGIDWTHGANFIAGYIEFLQNKIDQLNNK